MELYFPFADYWWFYAGFTGFVLVLLAADLGLFHRQAHAVTIRESVTWSVIWVALALAFGYGFHRYAAMTFGPDVGRQIGLEFLAGYVVEKALAVDNVFLFVLVFASLGIPAVYQHRILFYGILGALVFRAIFIALGTVLLQYHLVVVLFGVFLILTGVKMLMMREKPLDPANHLAVRLLRRLLPVTPELHGPSFLVRLGGRLHATPLLVALALVEMSDIIFAVDSVPAIFAVTREPLVVFTSNVFAILGLRSMYFLLAGAADRFHLLKYALALVLVFVGLKMVWLNGLFGGTFPIVWSLGIIGAIVGGGVAASLLWPSRSYHEAPRPDVPVRTAAH